MSNKYLDGIPVPGRLPHKFLRVNLSPFFISLIVTMLLLAQLLIGFSKSCTVLVSPNATSIFLIPSTRSAKP